MFEHAKETKIPGYGRQAVTFNVLKNQLTMVYQNHAYFSKGFFWMFLWQRTSIRAGQEQRKYFSDDQLPLSWSSGYYSVPVNFTAITSLSCSTKISVFHWPPFHSHYIHFSNLKKVINKTLLTSILLLKTSLSALLYNEILQRSSLHSLMPTHPLLQFLLKPRLLPTIPLKLLGQGHQWPPCC